MDALVIGAGLGGLAASIALASRGLRVAILEAAEAPGGKAGRITVEGAELDTGPSLLTMPEVFDEILARAGTSLRDELTLRDPSPLFRYAWPDGARLEVMPHLDDTLASVRATFGARAASELEAYLAHAGRIWSAAAPAFVRGPAPSLLGVARLGPRALGLVARIDPLRSLGASIRAFVREPHLVDVLERYATYNGSDARRAPATLGCIAHVELVQGGWGVEGGIRAIVGALVRAASALGVEIRCGTTVERIVVERGRVRGVIAAGQRIDAAAVVANADPALVLGPLLGRSMRAPLEPSMSGWNAIVRARRRDRAPHEVWFPADYHAEHRDVFDRGQPPESPTIYVCAQERAHGTRAWPDHEPLFVMVNAPPEPARGESADETWVALEARVRARLEREGIVAHDDRIVWRRTPKDLARRFPGSRGAIYGSSSSSRRAAFVRPPNEVRDVPGLFLASGGAHPGGGMPLSALSGLHAARALLARR